jgi:DNA-binding transcriptional regulator PaaX
VEQYCGDDAIEQLIELTRNGVDEGTVRVALRRMVPDFTDRLAIVGREGRQRTSGTVHLSDIPTYAQDKKARRASGQHPQFVD